MLMRNNWRLWLWVTARARAHWTGELMQLMLSANQLAHSSKVPCALSINQLSLVQYEGTVVQSNGHINIVSGKLNKVKQLNRRNPAALYEPMLSASSRLPLEALLLLPLLSDLGELPLVVLPSPAVLGLAPGVVLHPLHLLLPRFHQLVVALADLLLLCDVGNTSFYFHMFLVRFSRTEGASEAKRPRPRFCQKKINNVQHHNTNYREQIPLGDCRWWWLCMCMCICFDLSLQ